MNKESTIHVFRTIPVLHTERLCLRKILPFDYKDMYEYSCRDDVTKYLMWKKHPCEEHTRQYIEYLQSRYRIGDYYDWAIEDKNTKKMIGTCGFTRFDFSNNSAEVGYVLNPSFWGQGICAEALSKIIEFGFETLGLKRIEARFMEENFQSRRVMEKCNMKFEGILKSAVYVKKEYKNIGICAIVR